MKTALLLCGGVFLTANFAATAAEFQISSPNATVQFQLDAGQDQMKYQVTMQGKTVIEPSELSFRMDDRELCRNVSMGTAERYEVNESYPWRGTHAEARNHCRGASIALTHTKSKTQFTLEVRAYDDGVTFRFIVPEGELPRIPEEGTRLILPDGTTVWYHDLGGH